MLAEIIVASFASTNPYVIVQKDVVCAPTPTLLNEVMGKYQEKPIWGGLGEDSRTVLFVNEIKGTWSIVMIGNDTACLIDAGDMVDDRVGGKKI
jgi:hypothetical protein